MSAKDTTMNTRSHISKQHGAMQMNLDNWTFWFKGQWYPLNNKTIATWQQRLTGKDRAWFTNAMFS